MSVSGKAQVTSTLAAPGNVVKGANKIEPNNLVGPTNVGTNTGVWWMVRGEGRVGGGRRVVSDGWW